MKTNLEQVQQIVGYWQPRLGLEKWTLRLAVVGPGSLEGAEGDCDPDEEGRTALIRINEEQPSLLGLHETVIHEMLHCVFWFASDEKPYLALLEQAFRDLGPTFAVFSVEKLKK